jgi:hypothetical protein
MTIKSAVSWLVIMAFTAATLSLLENRLLWGFWYTRPSLVENLKGMDELCGVSVLFFEPDLSIKLGPRSELDSMAQFCSRPINECIEGSLLVQLRRDKRPPQSVPEVNPEILDLAWEHMRSDILFREGKDSRHPAHSGHPVRGLAVHFRESGESYILLSYRTSEISEDRHMYLETLLRLPGNNKVVVVRSISFFFEIAGLEFLTVEKLFPINFLLISTLFILTRWLWSLHERRDGKAASRG